MLSNIKIYLIGVLTIISGIFAFLFQNQILKRKTEYLKSAKREAQINSDVAKVLASHDTREVLKRVRKEIKKINASTLDA